jgi:uncharacterized membrane protein
MRGRPLDPLVLIRGLPGHPLHPPLADATIGMFMAVPTALTGLADWLTIEWRSRRWRTATWHLSAMLTAAALFALAAWRQHPGYRHGDVTTGGLVLTLVGAAVLVLGGWLGGSLVFVHRTRVLDEAGERLS